MQEDILTDVEQDLVAQFLENEPLVEAVRKVLTQSIYYFGVQEKGKRKQANINWLLRYTPAWNIELQDTTPDKVGLKVMIAAEALAQLENAFTTLSDYKKAEVKEGKNKNEAR